MYKKFIYFISLSLSLSTFTACNDDDNKDTTGPVINLTDPANEATFKRGEDIHIEGELSDESGINNYKVDIHSAEGHDHNTLKSTTAKDIAWTFQKVYEDARGKKNAHIHLHTDIIPENAKTGEYHLGLLVTDVEGNESIKYIEIIITE